MAYVYPMTTNLHAHVSTSAPDCDGPTGHDYIIGLNEEEVAHHEQQDGVNDFHDLMFKDRVLTGVISTIPEYDAEVHIRRDGFTYNEPTEEGYRAAEVSWCEDEGCDPNAESRYDAYAEAMGY